MFGKRTYMDREQSLQNIHSQGFKHEVTVHVIKRLGSKTSFNINTTLNVISFKESKKQTGTKDETNRF